MACIRLLGAACAVSIAFVSTTSIAQTAPARSPAATLWQLRSGLNVAALACRQPEDDMIVAGYNKLLADHRDELAVAYKAQVAEFSGPAAFDDAMTRLYNRFAAPAGADALCDSARVVLDEANAHPERPLGELAAPALAMLEDAFVQRPQPLPVVTVAAVDMSAVAAPAVSTVAYLPSGEDQ